MHKKYLEIYTKLLIPIIINNRLSINSFKIEFLYLLFLIWHLINKNVWILKIQFSSVQSLTRVWLFATLWTAARQTSLSITNSWSLLKLTSIQLMMPSKHTILCHPILLPPPIFSSIRNFFNELVLHIRLYHAQYVQAMFLGKCTHVLLLLWPKCFNFTFFFFSKTITS